ncbi:MAG: enoyl-CoA hydratase/isomerase family protein, partial [Myxococcota bacterium]
MSAVLYEVSEGIARVTLNRPKVLNALNLPLMGELRAVLDRAANDPEVRVVVIT